MKCIECDCLKKGWYKDRPNAYVCIGVPEPFVVLDAEVECTEYEEKRKKKDSSDLEKKKEAITKLIYNYVDYMYCDNCRFNIEMENYDGACDSCHRKYNGWGISMEDSECLAEKIMKELGL